jgi:hypothetical protein
MTTVASGGNGVKTGDSAGGMTGSGYGGIPSTTAAAGAAGTSKPTVSGAVCSPGQTVSAVNGGSSRVTCYKPPYSWPWEMGIPNGNEDTVSVISYHLPTPMTPGATSAVSFEIGGNAPCNFEIWGTTTTCGQAAELLWWAPFAAGTHCAEFVPSAAYSDVLLIHRKMYEISNWAYSAVTTTLCPVGTCQGKPTGNAKSTSAAISAPPGAYPINRLDLFNRGWDLMIGTKGRVVMVPEGSRGVFEQVLPVAAGVFRLQGTDPYSDAWYCMGSGSTVVQHKGESGNTNSFDLAMRNITRLGVCADHVGSGTLAASFSNTTAALSGTLANISGSAVSVERVDCFDVDCRFRLHSEPKFHFIFANLGTSPGTYTTPTHQTVPVLEGAIFTQLAATERFELACASSGTFLYEPTGTTTLSLTNVGPALACPGAPVTNAAYDMRMELF